MFIQEFLNGIFKGEAQCVSDRWRQEEHPDHKTSPRNPLLGK